MQVCVKCVGFGVNLRKTELERVKAPDSQEAQLLSLCLTNVYRL